MSRSLASLKQSLVLSQGLASLDEEDSSIETEDESEDSVSGSESGSEDNSSDSDSGFSMKNAAVTKPKVASGKFLPLRAAGSLAPLNSTTSVRPSALPTFGNAMPSLNSVPPMVKPLIPLAPLTSSTLAPGRLRLVINNENASSTTTTTPNAALNAAPLTNLPLATAPLTNLPIPTFTAPLAAPSLSKPTLSSAPSSASAVAPPLGTLPPSLPPSLPSALATSSIPALPSRISEQTTLDINAIFAKMPGISLTPVTAAPTADISAMILKEADETDSDFEARRRLTLSLAAIPDYKLNNATAVTVAHMMMKKSKLGLTYDKDVEAAILYLTGLLQRT